MGGRLVVLGLPPVEPDTADNPVRELWVVSMSYVPGTVPARRFD